MCRLCNKFVRMCVRRWLHVAHWASVSVWYSYLHLQCSQQLCCRKRFRSSDCALWVTFTAYTFTLHIATFSLYQSSHIKWQLRFSSWECLLTSCTFLFDGMGMPSCQVRLFPKYQSSLLQMLFLTTDVTDDSFRSKWESNGSRPGDGIFCNSLRIVYL